MKDKKLIMKGKCMKRKSGTGIMLSAALVAAMVLCMGCSTGEATTSDNPEPTTEDVVETPTPSAEEVTVQPEEAQPDGSETEKPSEPEETGSEEQVEPEAEEDADEWTALYNEYKEQGVIYFTLALCEAGYDQICLVNGDSFTTTYFSAKDGNHHTITGAVANAFVYVPSIPTEFSCNNENIEIHYWYKESDNPEDTFINCIQLDCEHFEGDDVPVNISVTFEDGSTQEITLYLTHHAE